MGRQNPPPHFLLYTRFCSPSLQGTSPDSVGSTLVAIHNIMSYIVYGRPMQTVVNIIVFNVI